MWSCGVIMYYLLAGSVPFKGSTTEETLKTISALEPKFDDKIWSKYEAEAKKLVCSLLDKNTATRINAQDALNHPWLKKLAIPAEEEKTQNQTLINSLRNLKNFKVKYGFQKIVLTYIISQFCDTKEEQKLSKIFHLIDRDEDGQVTESDLYEAYFKLYKDEFKAKRDSTEVIKRADLNGNGVIDYSGNSCYNYRILNCKCKSFDVRK